MKSLREYVRNLILLECKAGEKRPGHGGASGILLLCDDGTVFLQKRSASMKYGARKWAIPGGSLLRNEKAYKQPHATDPTYTLPIPPQYRRDDDDPLFWYGANQEWQEETGFVTIRYGAIVETHITECLGWKYKTFVCFIPEAAKKKKFMHAQPQPAYAHEIENHQWMNEGEFKSVHRRNRLWNTSWPQDLLNIVYRHFKNYP